MSEANGPAESAAVTAPRGTSPGSPYHGSPKHGQKRASKHIGNVGQSECPDWIANFAPGLSMLGSESCRVFETPHRLASFT